MGVQDSPTRLDAVVRGYLQSGWEDGGELIIPSEPLHALIEARARRHPEREAVLGGGSGLSYRELTVRADQIARLLLARGVQTEDRVAVCLPRTPELVAVLLGILKAGACYVPLDAAYPRERLELMLRSSGAALLLTDSSLLPGLPESEARPLLLDQLPEPHGADHPPAPFPTVHPGQLANVIYTSGSTGVPKGVAIEHRSVAALAAWAGRLYSPAELAGVLAGTSICFDLSVFELFVTLCCGGTVVLAANALGLKDLPERDRVTLVNTVPSAIKELARVGGIPPGVLTINLAGEALSPELVDLLYATTGVERVYDLYGPTEDTVYSTCALRLPHSAATIGRPLPGTRAYVLDADLQPPAPGEAGELYLGGAGLARGYLHRPDLTRERFVSCPLAGAPDERVYRTGDLVRRLPDGQLEYLGRLDQQVKIRGYRIELGDIEAAIRRQPGIRDTVVTAPESATGDRRLVAYVVWEAGEPGELSSLRRALGDSLPGYMLPEALVTLDRIPLTPNGKIDRRALPLPAVDDTPGEHLAPRTELEAALARIWSRVLGREAVGIHDDFFDQGGHSLLAMRVLQQIQQELSLDPPVRLLFEERTVAGLAAALAQLPPAATTASLPLPQAAEERVPASAQQEALWFLEQLYPGQNGYNIPIVLRLSGPVDGAALAKCLQELVARHPLLRSRLAADASGVGLEFTSVPDTVLVYADLESVPAPQREQAARQAALQVCDPPFDLSVAPLFRAQLLRLGETEWRLVLCIHHAVADGLSIELLLRELGVLYNARKAGHATPLAEMAAGYPDYCRWQGEQLRGDALRTQRSYWKQQLAGLDPVLAFPADRPRPAHFTAQGGRVRSTVSARTVQRVEALARRQKVTLFMVLLAAFAVLLQRYSQQEELGVGTPVAGRSRPEFEGVFGYFVNTLPLRIDCTGDPSFAALLRRVRETCTGAFGHADLPFAQIVEALEVPRDPSRAPLTQAWLTLQDEPAHLLQLRGIEAELLPVDPGTAKVDLLLMLERSDGEIQATLEYYASVTAPETATRFLEQFVRLLEALDTAAEQPLSRLPLLSEAETTRVTRTWNETRTPYPAESVHRLFEAQVRRTPEAAALVSEEGTVSYAELNERANRMARWLQANGAVTGDLVGIYLPRSAELVAVLLGILKAGAAYLPLDLASPPERLRMMLAEAGAPLVVTSTSLAAALGEPDCRVLQIDGPEANLAAYAVGNLDLDAAPDDLAYVMFTSGSSGKPKGVEIPHRAIARLVFGVDYCAFGPAETHLLLAPVSFDASTFELWGALLHGGRCALFPDALPTLEALGAALRDYEVTTLWLTASLFNFVIDEEPELLGGLRRLLTGGEVLSVPHVRRALDLLPHLQLVNGYGPTEGTTFTCCFPIPRPLSDYCSVPLGSPLANTRVYVLDRSLQPVPIGVAGELYIAGDGLARGYLNDAELTARRFVKLTIAGVTERAYRSGDLARWRADGTLEFLGRADRQVKIRGHRIEPGEIEAQLGQCAEVAASVVLVQPGAGGEPELRAYVVPRPGPPPDETALLARLAQRLPAYLVPGRIAFVRRLPLTVNGKVDAAALAAMNTGAPTVCQREKPRPGGEQDLAALWTELLGVAEIDRKDSFFALGGHSLLAARLISRVERAFGVRLSLRRLLESPTLEGLARAVTAADPSHGSAAALPFPIRPAPSPRRRKGPAPLSFAQQRLWFLERLDHGSHAYVLPVAFRLSGPLLLPALHAAFSALVERHEVLRTLVAEQEGSQVQVVLPAAELPLPLTDLSRLSTVEQERRVREELRLEGATPFDLERGPLLRVRLLRLAPEEHRLLITQHHLISDGWSISILCRELEALYAAYAAGQEPSLPALPLQYGDFAAWQREAAGGEVLDGQIHYWTRRLSGVQPLDLPVDQPRALQTDPAGASQSLTLPPTLVAQLREAGEARGATPFMVLLAALAVVLQRWTGQTDLVVGAPIADRQYVETEGLMGLFLNNLVLRVELQPSMSFSELLEHVGRRTLEAFENQDVPFERLVEILQPVRDPARHPLFEVMLNYVNTPSRELALPGLEVETIELPTHDAKLPLTLYALADGDSLALRLVYQKSLFRAERMRELLEQYARLLHSVVADPTAPVDSYQLLDPTLRHRLPDPREELPAPEQEDVAAVLDRVAARLPEHPAVRQGKRAWSYAQLHSAADTVTGALAALAPGTVVAVTGARTFGLVAAVVGVLRSQAVLLTLDPELPASRRGLMLAEAGARVLLVVGDLPIHETTPLGCDVVRIDPDTGRVAGGEPLPRGPVSHAPDDPAYVFFTSGSTGTPKAVLGRRCGLAHFLAWQRETFRVGPGDRVAQLTGLSFDVILRDLLLPLCSGATLCLPREEERSTHPRLLEWLRREQVTLLHLVPSLARAWLGSLDAPTPLPALRCVFFAGEPLTDQLVRRWREQLPGAPGGEIINLYGPTETTLAKCWFRVPDAPTPGTQPIGQPLPDTQVLVLQGDRPCAAYEPGELVIRTPFRSLGYLNAATADTARFVPNPFRDDPDDLVYRTGDLGYLLPDGTLAILGRQDDQVKIRGVRVEPAEVAAVLRAQPGIRDAAVLAVRKDDEYTLVAYLVAADDPQSSAELSQVLRGVLPLSHVPSAFVYLDRLPLNANGKLDRRALPAPSADPGGEAAGAASTDELELRLLRIWRDVLRAPHLGPEDDFFGAGGHSLLGVQLVTRVEKELGQALPLAVLFQAPTVRGFAGVLRTGGWRSTWQSLVAIQPEGSRPPLFLVHGIGGGVLCFRDLAAHLGPDQPLYGLQAVTLGGAEREYDRIEEMAAHYVRELRSLQPAGPYHLGGFSFGGTVALEMAQQLRAAGQEVALLALLDTKAPGYPEFPAWPLRAAAHLHTYLKGSPNDRREYLRVRVRGVRDQVRRRTLLLLLRQRAGAVDRALDDIGIQHIHAAYSYTRDQYPGKITLLRAEVQPIGCRPEPTNGWSRYALDGVEVLPIPGEHATIVEEPHVRELARQLQGALARAGGGRD